MNKIFEVTFVFKSGYEFKSIGGWLGMEEAKDVRDSIMNKLSDKEDMLWIDTDDSCICIFKKEVSFVSVKEFVGDKNGLK